MGLQKRENTGGGNALFFKLNAKEGCIQSTHKVVDPETGQTKNEKVKERPGDATLTGTLMGIEVQRDEYQGQVNFSLRLKLADTEPGQPNMYVDLPFGSEANGASMFGLQIMGKLNAADLNKPISLTPWFIAAGTMDKRTNTPNAKDRSGCVVSQDGVKLKEDFGDGESKLPELPVVKVGSKEVKDKSPWDNLAQTMLSTLVDKLTPHEAEGSSEADDEVDPGEIAGAVQNATAARTAFAPRQ
jgi:hypothetical protein